MPAHTITALTKINNHKEFKQNPLQITDFMSAGSIMDLVKGRGHQQINQPMDMVNIRKVEERDQNDVIETFAHSFSETEILTSGKNRFSLNTTKYLLVSNI